MVKTEIVEEWPELVKSVVKKKKWAEMRRDILSQAVDEADAK